MSEDIGVEHRWPYPDYPSPITTNNPHTRRRNFHINRSGGAVRVEIGSDKLSRSKWLHLNLTSDEAREISRQLIAAADNLDIWYARWDEQRNQRRREEYRATGLGFERLD